MCCFTTIFLLLISRLGIIGWWLANPGARGLAFQNTILPLPAWLYTLIGGIILPWTTLAYLFVFQGGISGYKWIILAVGLLIDLAGHGGTYHHRNRFPRRGW